MEQNTIKSTVVLSESQRGILQIALEIARDKFLDNVRILNQVPNNRLAEQFEKQAIDADVLLNIVTLADEIAITETVSE